ncbi:MAG: hypothetical protein ACI9A7_001023 [Cyclobacteriaceae bacterium]|jgi:hypothetical protein
MKFIILYLSLNFLSLPFPISQKVDESKTIKNLLIEFLEKVDSKEMHERFWDENLTYTSSSGERFGKNTIMSGFESEPETQEKANSPFSAEDIAIRILDEMAILNFTLVFDKEEGKTYYFNSGVLQKKNRKWTVINWHVTKKALDK